MNLAKTQFLSLATKGITTALGIAQSVIVIRLLTPADFGLVGLVMSIGGVIGVSQHLGIVDGAIREIAVLKSKREVGKVFWVSHLVRQLVTIPLSVAMFALAGFIAVYFYDKPEIIPYIQLFSAVLILQGLQDVLGATLTGMKRFISLYVVQIVTAAINIGVFGYLTWQYGISGFFWAIIITTGIMIALFSIIIGKELGKNLALPSWSDLRQYGRRVLRVGVYMYISRIFFVVWQRLPLLLLGAVISADELGFLNVSLTFGSKLTIIAMALSEVNLSWMSSLFAKEKSEFVKVVTRNMHRVLVLMMMLTLVMLFFTPEILQYIIGSEYLPAHKLILVMTLAFFLYSLSDIGTSSLFVSADKPKLRAYVYGTMTAITAGIIWILQVSAPDPLRAAFAVLAGAVLGYIAMIILAKKQFNIPLLTMQLFIFLLALGSSVAWLFTEPALVYRILVFLVLAAYFTWEAHKSQLIPPSVVAWLPLRSRRNKISVISKEHTGPAPIICFAGAEFNQASWTNRQHVMSRVSQLHPVLYIEPRLWIFKYVLFNWNKPGKVLAYLRRLFWYEKVNDNLFIKSQWNLIPGSREIRMIAAFNHYLNRFWVVFIARYLGMMREPYVVWMYDTEAAEYLSAFPHAITMYDCVDDHAAQAGVDRNSNRVRQEEEMILQRADVVSVTSKRLLALKKKFNPNTHLVLNVGNVDLFQQPAKISTSKAVYEKLTKLPQPIIGSVGTLDAYKIDFALVESLAKQRPDWNIVLIGSPLVDHSKSDIRRLQQYKNIHLLGAIPKEEVPAYVKHFDVCMIPYKNNRYNQASFPLKFWEFMVTGKPIVVSGCPELREYKPLIGYAKSAKEMIRYIEHALTYPQENVAERIEQAQGRTWSNRVKKLLELLNEAVAARYTKNQL